MPSPRKARAMRAEGEELEASSPYNPPEDEDIRSDFFSIFDPNAFLAELEAYTQNTLPTPKPIQDTQLDVSSEHMYSPFTAHAQTQVLSQAQSQQQPQVGASNAHGQQSEFYGTAIQILTHILGSSQPYPWLAPDTPRQPQTSDTVPNEPDLQRLINTLIERLGGNAAPPGGIREQDLTRLLHSLMEQQQQSPSTQKAATAAQPSFADLNLPEEEDEDDPDFYPLPGDTPQDALPSDSAWTRAMHEVVGMPIPGPSTEGFGQVSPPLSPAKATRSQKRLQAELAAPLQSKPRPGRTKIYTSEEAAERKRERNRTYAKKQRQKLRRQRLGLTSDNGDDPGEHEPHEHDPPELPQSYHHALSPTASRHVDDGLMLAAENRILREELERLRDENARLRGREEMRAYVARMRSGNAPELYM